MLRLQNADASVELRDPHDPAVDGLFLVPAAGRSTGIAVYPNEMVPLQIDLAIGVAVPAAVDGRPCRLKAARAVWADALLRTSGAGVLFRGRCRHRVRGRPLAARRAFLSPRPDLQPTRNHLAPLTRQRRRTPLLR
jgi:hypothetical protein